MTQKKFCPKIEIPTKQHEKQFGYFYLYRFASNFERILIFLGIIFSLIKAFTLPLMLMVYGEFTTLLIDRNYGIGTSSKTIFLQLLGGGNIITNGTVEENRIEIINDSVSYGILMGLTAFVQFLAGILSVDLFNYTALKQVTRIRTRFFNSILRQEIGWFDVTGGNSIGTRLTDDVEKIREGIGEKVAHFLNLMIGVVFCLLISFLYGWELTLVVIAYVPIVSLTNIYVTKYQAQLTEREMDGYSKAGTVVEEVLAAIRTVISFGGEEKECERYKKMLEPAQIAGRRRGLVSGCGEGLVRCLFFASTGLAFWYGTNLVLQYRFAEEKVYTATVLMIVCFGLLCSADNIARGSIFLETFSTAKGAAAQIFKIIDRVSEIDSLSLGGKIITYGLKGDVTFKDVCFHYPSRPDVPILDKLNVTLHAGQTIALVGNSGNGKSSCLHLLQRFYDVTSGVVQIDGHNIKDFNINWLRSNIAVVRQEPVLFATTIEENIRYGKTDATRKEIEDAARAAGAHNFIIKLPESYATSVGELGSQLSGGQKQRIAIARAFIQNPKILLLDEATSALDSHAEKRVMEALDKCRRTRTTIIVSHRLSAIRNADRILFVSKGQIVEDGTHDDLIALKGLYYNMVNGGTLENDELFEQNVVNETEEIESDESINKEVIKESLNDFHDEKQSQHHVHFIPVPYKEQEDDYNEDGDFSKLSTFGRLLVIAYPEWLALFVSILAGILAGASYPAFAIILGELYANMSVHDSETISNNADMLAIALVVIGIITGLSVILQTHLVNWSGIKFASRIRSMVFTAVMQQEVGWYDEDTNSVGALTSRIAGDTANVQGAIGYPMSGVVQSMATIVLGSISAFSYNWKLALVCLSTVPFVVASYVYEAKHMAKTQIIEKSMIEEASKIATEAITNIRTVACLRQESPVISRFCTEIHKIEATVRRKLMYRGSIYSSGQSLPLFGYALALYYGGLLVANEGVPYGNIIKTTESLLYVSIIVGQSLAFFPSFTSAFVAGHRLFKMLDRRPRIRDIMPEGRDIIPDVDSNVSYSSVQFRYPKRPDIPILQGFNLEVFQGKTVALVGNSGCGKSTCVRLLQRFYDADNGRINLGKDDITAEIKLKDLRSKLGLVSQEPVLFDRTIAENIAYGDNTRQIPVSEIVEAAKMANIHNFIVSLPNGYDTNLGTGGAQLSGGQKQRIAIARALIRNPKVLLLDEATSALDIQSEKAVQQALDLASSGRTCLVITHRLSTIQNADVICVVQNGVIHEQGTHAELIALDGLYAKLNQMRSEDLH